MSDESRTRFALKELLMPLAIVGAGWMFSASSREAERSKLSQDLILALSNKTEDRAKTIALFQILQHHDPEAAAPLQGWIADLSLNHAVELVAQGRMDEAESFDRRLKAESPQLYKTAAQSEGSVLTRGEKALAVQAETLNAIEKDPDKAPEAVKQLQALPTVQAQAAARDLQAASQTPAPGGDDAARRQRILEAVAQHAVRPLPFKADRSTFVK